MAAQIALVCVYTLLEASQHCNAVSRDIICKILMKILSFFVKHTSSYVLLQYCESLELVTLFKTVNLTPTPRLDTKILAQTPRGISGACLDEQLCLIGNFFFHAKSGEIEPFSRDCESLRLVLVLTIPSTNSPSLHWDLVQISIDPFQ